ncbi:hypothetical protein [Streptomyces xanthophaeus]|uniref:Uncharacterized protein n=1 Tax=Streptomyces xanthophaeus TaxID=67385 RepID=A0A919L9R0_9ACTN|nr:hypothetical protein [Streptomyces xanthophaeus]GHI84138.1 hypothetical protein Sxan_15020 [Streptomyces xanthophaeus]
MASKQRTQPLIFLSTDQHVPGHLHYPEDVAPADIVSRFPAGTFAWNELGSYAEFPAHMSAEVMQALHVTWPYVDISYGKHEGQPTSSNTVKRPASARPGSWQAMGPRKSAV